MPPGGRKQRGGLALALLFFGWAQAPAAADSSAHSFPDRPVKVIVQTAAGASIDVAARIIADALSRRWRQQAMVLNQPGAGGAVAAKALIAAPADGHTLLLAASSIFVVLPELQRHSRLDPDRLHRRAADGHRSFWSQSCQSSCGAHCAHPEHPRGVNARCPRVEACHI
jgi:tripartite-type tricarboxylate transporter receptor subunit TctC